TRAPIGGRHLLSRSRRRRMSFHFGIAGILFSHYSAGVSAKRAAPPPSTANTDELVAKSEAMRCVIRLAEQVATVHVPVLLTGEGGAGREHIAEYIHDHSSRREKPFHVIDCTSVPEELFESALFGHAKGALGVLADHVGVFEEASGGTLLLYQV